ncbi:matrixin family metalloprotease [Cytobacillus sp. IB215665]|uniref:matrixin family metalloprotease n=1 Tax=Cytobacillus sp. IB215665 TaxID=3097357 RepID=UPI002A0C2E7E|nr:matrixin family metalloprotease [Cytobacillus sp. IB215665]MDX8367302.1 matrixin family metalloprotease [Cytobacillus sp. IB215665]
MSSRINSKVRLLFLSAMTILMLFGIVIGSTNAAPTDEHPSSNCYKKISRYSGWEYDNNQQININFTYTQNGSYDYSYRIDLAGEEWNEHFSFFNFNEVSRGNNLAIESDDYGDTGWVGAAYYARSPKDIYLNEYYHKNYSWYGFVEYERTAIHEYGHTHGLSHTSCTTEIMSNNSNRDISQVDLGDGDISGIRSIY